MKILFVMDEYFAQNNGLSLSAQRFSKALRERGNEVRIIAGSAYGTPDYALKEYVVPVFDGLIKKQGMTFAKTDDEIVEKAVRWADVVYLEEPFVLDAHAAREAKKQGKPCTGGFHMYPENITSSLHLAWNWPLNAALMIGFKLYVYRYCSDIHCPTKYVEQRLLNYGYRSRLHVISNGVTPEFAARRAAKPDALSGKFVILSVGRYSVEKRQDILIEAVKRSKYSSQIQLIFAGQGPRKNQYMRQAKGLKNSAIFKFMSQQELIRTMNFCDLYVHTADSEVEGMSALEAISCGLVPVISNSGKSSTKVFALDDRSIFNAGDPESLKARIDYWISHNDERARMGIEYSCFAKKYSVERSAERLENMFMTACGEEYGIEEEALQRS